jgi:hypothetical protein
MFSSRPFLRTTSRRRLLGGAAASALGLAALGHDLPGGSGAVARTAAQTAPRLGDDVPPAGALPTP